MRAWLRARVHGWVRACARARIVLIVDGLLRVVIFMHLRGGLTVKQTLLPAVIIGVL